MPLKTEDLKTVENYRKAIKLEAGRIKPSGDTRFWVYRDVELPTASGQKQKLPALIALADDTAIRPLLKGKKLACRGTCGLEGDKIAFQADQGKVPYAVLIKSVPLLLGKMLHIPAGADTESDGEDTSAPPLPPAGAPPPARYADLNASWKKLAEQANQKMAADPAQREALTKAMAGIPEMLQGGKLVEAQKRIEQLDAALKVPPAPAPAPPGSAPRYADLNASWKKLAEQANQKMATDPAQRAALTKAMAGIPEMLQGGKLVDAQKRIEQLEATLTFPDAGSQRRTLPGWSKLEAQVTQAISKYPDQKAELQRASAGIEEMIRLGKIPLANRLMGNLLLLLQRVRKGGGAAQPAQKRTAELAETWKAVSGDVNRAIARFPEMRGQLMAASAAVDNALKAGQLDMADRLIDALFVKIAELRDAQLEFQNWYARMEEIIDAYAKGDSENANKIRLGRGLMLEKAEAGDFEGALALMDRVMDLVSSGPEEEDGEQEKGAQEKGSAAKAQTPRPNLVQYRQTFGTYATAHRIADDQIKTFLRAVAAQLPEEVVLGRQLAQRLQKLHGDLKDVVMATMKASENEAAPAPDAVKARIRKSAADLAANKLVQMVDSNPLGVTMSLAKTLGDALAGIEKAMPA